MNHAINVKNLVKSYGTNKIIDNISFSVASGETFALLGVNGAGKTTTLECIEGLRKFDSGDIRIQGIYGVQLQSSSIPQNMKTKEAITLFSKWRRASIEPEYLSRLGVLPFMKKQYAELSIGQKRRLHLALALLGNPDIIFLDEPTAGLDVQGRAAIHEEIRTLKKRGTTIILASHDMSEVEELCDRIAILKDGKIAFCGTSEELTKVTQNVSVLKIRFSQDINLSNTAKDDKGYYVFMSEHLEDTLLDIIKYCKSMQIAMTDVRVEHAGIEQRFLEIAEEEL